MPENPVNPFETFYSEVAHAMRQAKLMVWAGDYQRAAGLLDEVGSRHWRELERAEKIGRSLLSARRDRRLRQQLLRELEQEARGKNLLFLLQERTAAHVAARMNYLDDDFAVAVLALAYSNLKRRVLESGESESTQSPQRRVIQKMPVDLPALAEQDFRTGFRYLEIRKDPGRFEIRAYRLNRQDVSPSVFVERLREFWRNARLIVEPQSQPGGGQWPIWFRAFVPDLVTEGFLPEADIAWFECTFADIQPAREIYRKILALLDRQDHSK